MSPASSLVASGLSLAPFRALRPTVGPERLGRLLCPPYDVIDEAERAELLARDSDNAVALILPRAADGVDAYRQAAEHMDGLVASGMLAPDAEAALYVYEMKPRDESATRGLIGAVELRDPADGVILPHEDTMAGPVADRLALMRATSANLEPIYLVYDGGGAASDAVRSMGDQSVISSATTPDGTQHRLWRIRNPDQLAAIQDDLATRRALIADGHHRYATYRELQQDLGHQHGAGPWDRGLTLLVDSTSYGPQVHAIHRVLLGLPLAAAIERARPASRVVEVADAEAGLHDAAMVPGFAAVLTDGVNAYLISEPKPRLLEGMLTSGEPAALAAIDVTVLHRVLVARVWQLEDRTDTVGYAHSIEEAVSEAQRGHGTAVLLLPTPVAAVAAVAAAGARMPRKSTLFTPKPASGMVMRRFADEAAG